MAALSVHLGVCSPNTLYWFILITPDIGTLYWVGQKVRLGCFFFFFPDHKKWNELFGQPNILLRKYRGWNRKPFSPTAAPSMLPLVFLCRCVCVHASAWWWRALTSSFLQFLPTVWRGELRLLVHLRLSSHAAVPVGGLALDLLPLWRDNPEVPGHLTWALRRQNQAGVPASHSLASNLPKSFQFPVGCGTGSRPGLPGSGDYRWGGILPAEPRPWVNVTHHQ